MLGRITTLHNKWLRYSPRGAMCDECQELNALHSSVVDGGSIRLPERLLSPPNPEEGAPPFVLDVLHEDSVRFVENFRTSNPELLAGHLLPLGAAEDTIKQLLTTESMAQSEYEVVQSALRVARNHGLDLTRYLAHVNFGALTTAEKYALIEALGLNHNDHPYIWNRFVCDLHRWIRFSIVCPAWSDRRYCDHEI